MVPLAQKNTRSSISQSDAKSLMQRAIPLQLVLEFGNRRHGPGSFLLYRGILGMDCLPPAFAFDKEIDAPHQWRKILTLVFSFHRSRH